MKSLGILEIASDRIVEIIPESNTAREMNDEAKDYLTVSVVKIRLIDSQTSTASLYQKSGKEVMQTSLGHLELLNYPAILCFTCNCLLCSL